ncbi:hypothetical protein XaFJ1_GM000403 [Xanthomonas albilineans]|nr:hypothetical protein XaFJ1_GM000403 [Xanthomonas albilineans]
MPATGPAEVAFSRRHDDTTSRAIECRESDAAPAP